MRKILTALFLSLTLAVPQSWAGMIPTEGSERDRVNAMLERPEVAQQLEKMGIPASQAKERVAAMNDAEVASLAGKLDSAIAGGALSNTDFLFILLVVLLVIVIL
jgi:hypothetical protein